MRGKVPKLLSRFKSRREKLSDSSTGNDYFPRGRQKAWENRG
jgi:hypothetical protein